MSTNKQKVVDKKNDKYKVVLKLANGILKNLNKDPIDDLTKFVKISKEDIIKKENIKLFNEMEDELFELFNKYSFKWYKRNVLKNYILVFLKTACSELNLKFASKRKEISEKINDIRYKRIITAYTILVPEK